MDIYISHDGEELGPFSEEDTQRMLKEGRVLINDLAWRPGMPEWIPLHGVLYPAPAPAAPAAPPPSPSIAASTEPATARQKAFLSYMGVSFAPEISKADAALLESDAVESPRDPARLSRWNEDRLRLHPELFAGELQTRKDNRAGHFFDIAQAEGAECFDGVGKAHCQVLINYLDTKFPNWDARETEATWSYFFPALAEKFPQIVRKEWRDKLKYPEGPKVAAELKRQIPAQHSPQRKHGSPIAALVKGLVFGAIVLGLIAGGFYLVQNPELLEKLKPVAKPAPAPAKKQETKVAAASPVPVATPVTPPESLFGGPAAATVTSPVTPAPPAGDPTMAQATMPAAGGAPADATMQPAPAAPSGLFDPNANMQPAAPANGASGLFAPAAPGGAPVAPTTAVRTTVVLTRAVDIQLAFGRVKVPAGTALKLLAQEGANVKVIFQNAAVLIPVSSTDLATEAASLPQ